MAVVELQGVTKVFDDSVYAVKNADLTIGNEEFVVLVGPSGCGKSTLLRMIAGLEEVTSGEIRIDGVLVNDMSPKDRDIAMVFQNYALYPHMTVFGNLSFGLKLQKFSKAVIQERVQEAARMLGIEDYLDRKPKALSGGQRQRVALGRALVRKPNVFLFDEPLSNLDAKLRVQMRVEISHLHQQIRTTMIYVTHDQTEAMTMSDKIVVLDKGTIQQVASPLELYNNPTNKFVAGFIGSPAMNFIRGKIDVNGSATFRSSHHSFELPENVRGGLDKLAGKEILLGVRPENISILPPTNNKRLSGPQDIVVDVVEPIGHEIFIYFSEGDARYCLRTDPKAICSPGDHLQIRFDLDSLYFFDAESDTRYA